MAGFILCLSGCSEEFLQDQKYDGLSDEVIFSSEETAVASVTGVYDTFQGSPIEYLTKAVFYPANFLTQDFLNIGADTFFQTFEIPTTFPAFNNMWIQNYKGIGRANTALDNLLPAVERGDIDAELGNRLMGECYAIRGILYSLLASNFGGVPIVVEPAGGNVDAFAPRNTQDEVFQQIVLDMQEAVKVLPWSYDAENLGRVTKGTAYAYMGSAYMWLGEYEKAIEAFEALEGHYTLEEEFLDIFAYDNQNGKESIFEIQLYDSEGDLGWGHTDNVTFLQSFTMPNEIANGGGYSAAAKALYDSFESGDERKLATVIGPGDEHPDPLINISDYPNIQENFGGINTCGTIDEPWLGIDGLPGREGYYGVKTWRNPTVDGWSGPNIFGGRNLIFMRYGEVLLSLAECYHRLGDNATAMDYVMQVRNRAGLTDEPSGNMIDVIIDEYRHELVGEFSLWWLFRRTGEHERYLQEEFGVTVPSGRDLMPIPQEQIDINPNLTQNPGY
ncbi:RagB/SusD family nutrient uptake outer membrane protein [Galbibacter sp. EGI 63066]|uniref:RagB/SusD family nutrient uptake outer membrane protein n=1 Tax=Galbibacter sp. EGI 63066 TaxID=2993559 RepID=UPI0022498029|nr:RagB/SusD family nutrient uptake outer membrane protein [Galbibacter sp. EGI 63066]MCX2680479.1 RagB/SusD family nutrient uptake outer membrane protein [Galbibacter sp. EGI 63066]